MWRRQDDTTNAIWDIEWLFAILGANFRTEAKYSCTVEASSESMLTIEIQWTTIPLICQHRGWVGVRAGSWVLVGDFELCACGLWFSGLIRKTRHAGPSSLYPTHDDSTVDRRYEESDNDWLLHLAYVDLDMWRGSERLISNPQYVQHKRMWWIRSLIHRKEVWCEIRP